MRIPTPEVATGQAGQRTYLLLRRYDRTDVGGRCRRLHQEDYCQALGILPSAKYESNQTGIRGPTLKDMFDITRRHMPPTEIVRLLNMIILNVLACNTDAHAKNYSIMLSAGNASLAPMYDIMCGEVWDNVTKNLAQKIAGINRGDHLNRAHWQQFARECGLNPKQVIDRIDALGKLALAEAELAASEVAAMPAGDHELLDQARRTVERRAHQLLAQLHELEDGPISKVTDGPARKVALQLPEEGLVT
jgi:serine/threonine-protein kinase HipA